jgi:hypothetical protein
VLRPLAPAAVDAARWAWTEELLTLLAPEVHPPMVPQLPKTERDVTELILGKPPEKPTGPSHYSILPVVRNCETQSFKDMAKMWCFMLNYVFLSTICCILICDGQAVEMWRNARRRYPVEYKRVLIGNGGMHSKAHCCFCINEGYWKVQIHPRRTRSTHDPAILSPAFAMRVKFACVRVAQCLLYTIAIVWLKKVKQIYEIMQDLQHDNYKHCFDLHRVSAAGILCFLILDVKRPSPITLIRDPRAYLAMVHHAGGIVIIHYLFCGAFPLLFWQRAGRAGRGSEMKMLYAWGWHCCRSLAHKPKEVYILSIALMGLCCAHPKLVKVLEDTCILSLLGKIFIFSDRFLEYINLLQQKRTTSFKGYDGQIQFSEVRVRA